MWFIHLTISPLKSDQKNQYKASDFFRTMKKEVDNKMNGLRKINMIQFSKKYFETHAKICQLIWSTPDAWQHPQCCHAYETISEGGYGINTQVEKSKKMTTVNFIGYDLNKLFWIFVDSWMW